MEAGSVDRMIPGCLQLILLGLKFEKADLSWCGSSRDLVIKRDRYFFHCVL